jgi:hypothetical protein
MAWPEEHLRIPGVGAGHVATSVAEDLVAAALGLLIVTALYFDGRAHVLELPDSFFTPWHAFLYGGLLLLSGWLGVISRRAAMRQPSERLLVIPAGYGYAVVGAVLFAVGGIADMIWHQIFGIENGIDALLSPTHLLLFVTGALLLSGPIRAFHRRSAPASKLQRVPPTMALLGITAIAAFALIFLSGFITEAPTFAVGQAPEGTEADIMADGVAQEGLASYLITSLVLVVPLTYLIRSRLILPGIATVLVTWLALLANVVEDFQIADVVIAALIAGALTDVLLLALQRLGRSPRAQELVLAAVLPLLLWSAQLLTMNLAKEVLWSVEMVTGVVLLSGLISFATVFVLRPEPGLAAAPPGD